MKKSCLYVLLLPLLAGVSACTTHHYAVTGVERTRMLVDKRYDAHPDKAAETLLKPYKAKVDSMMSPVVGRTARYLSAGRPESPLSNLLADILVDAAGRYNEKADFAVYNMGGIRAAFPKGDVTVGDVLEVAPFENKICFISLTGEQVNELFAQIAERGGEGVSHAVQMEISPNGELKSAKLAGKTVEPTAMYRVATIDYLAQGNDGLKAFTKGTNLNSPKEAANNLRFVIMDYFKKAMVEGREVDARNEGRVTVTR